MLARESVKVGISSRTEKVLVQPADQIREAGGEALVLPADTSSPAELVQAVEKLRVEWGRLDIVFANAGINGVWSALDKLSVEEWRKTLSINLDGTILYSPGRAGSAQGPGRLRNHHLIGQWHPDIK